MASHLGLIPLLLVIAGVGLAIAEAMAPGAHFIVLGVALLVAGLVGLLIPAVASPLVLALLVLIVGGGALYGYREFTFYGGDSLSATTDSSSLKGRSGRVTERVTETTGQVKLDSGGFNPRYSARTINGEIPEGREVIVVDPGGGNVLTVESMDVIEDDIDRELAKGREQERSEVDSEQV